MNKHPEGEFEVMYLKFEHCSKAVPFSFLSGLYHFLTLSSFGIFTVHLGIEHKLMCPTCKSKFRIEASGMTRLMGAAILFLLILGPLFFFFGPPVFPRFIAPYLSLAYVAAILPKGMSVVLKRSYFKKLLE